MIVSDYEMPYVNGIEFLKLLRGAGNTTPFIIFSGRGREDVVIEALNFGADFYIQKGGDPKAQFVELKNQILHIVQRKRAEAALMQSEARYRLITDNMSDSVWLMDLNMNLTFVSPSAVKKRGFSIEELLSMSLEKHLTSDSYNAARKIIAEHLSPEKLKIRDTEVSVTTELEFMNKVGTSTWNEVTISLIRDQMGDPIGFVGMNRDITARKKAEEILIASLHEKELLLREIHHRVKNNLQIIASLLYLQSITISDEFTVDVLRESQSRVKSMALIHEKLYRSKDLARIPFSIYLESLIETLKEAYGVRNENVTIEISVTPPDLSLNIETGIPCGLIINELISNALKYAFNDGRKGVIRIDMRHVTPQNYHLIIADNGCGLSEKIDFRNTTSLGLQLVNNLVTQLDGTIELDTSDGTKFSMLLKPIEDYNKK